MTKGQRTIATLLVLVATLLGGIVIVQTSSPAAAGTVGGVASGVADDGTCPSDVNGDAVVNVLDLIDLLLDFGMACPAAKIVGVAPFDPGGVEGIVRIWSDGFAEFKVSIRSKVWNPQVWTPLPVNPDAPQSRPVAVGSTAAIVYRLWEDGTVDSLRFAQDGQDSAFPGLEGWITEPN